MTGAHRHERKRSGPCTMYTPGRTRPWEAGRRNLFDPGQEERDIFKMMEGVLQYAGIAVDGGGNRCHGP